MQCRLSNDDGLLQVKMMSDSGVKEVTLLGQNVNSYADRSHITGDAPRRQPPEAALVYAQVGGRSGSLLAPSTSHLRAASSKHTRLPTRDVAWPAQHAVRCPLMPLGAIPMYLAAILFRASAASTARTGRAQCGLRNCWRAVRRSTRRCVCASRRPTPRTSPTTCSRWDCDHLILLTN